MGSERRVGIPRLVKGTNELIDYFDTKNWPVIHVLTVHKADKSTWPMGMLKNNNAVLIEGTDEPKELKEIKNSSQHHELIKTRHSSFIRTNLEEMLRNMQVNTIVIAGVFLHGCVAMTAIDGSERDFGVIVSRDASFSHKLELAAAYEKSVTEEYGVEYISNKQIMERLSEIRGE